MAVELTPRMQVHQWTSGADPYTRAQRNLNNLNIEQRAAGFLAGTTAERPAASALMDRFFYWDETLDVLRVCVDTVGDGTGYAWINPFDTRALPDGTAAEPALAFANDPDTGLFRSGIDNIGFATGGVERMRVSQGNGVLFLDGSTTAPALSFLNDTDTGITRGSSGEILLINDGTTAGDFYAGKFRASDGTVALPGIMFRSDMDTGLYRIQANEIGIAAGGAEIARVSAGVLLTLGRILSRNNGAAGTPTFSFNDDPDTGAYRHVAGGVMIASDGNVVACSEFNAGLPGWFPANDNATLLGRSGRRWSQVWAASGTIQTSDETTKAEVADADLGLEFVRKLRPIRYRFTEGARPHYGLSAQQVRAALDDLDVEDFAGYIDPAVEAAARVNPYAGEPTVEHIAAFLPSPFEPDPEPDPEPEPDTATLPKAAADKARKAHAARRAEQLKRHAGRQAERRAEHAARVEQRRADAAADWVKAREHTDAETAAMAAAPLGLRYDEFIAPLIVAVQELADERDALAARVEELEGQLAGVLGRLDAAGIA